MARSGKKEKWIAYTLAVLLCLVLTSFWLMCNVYARYSTEASGGDNARVAKFAVTETDTKLSQQINVAVYPGFSQTYNVGVTNKSEVAIAYVMEVKNEYKNLPLKFQMQEVDANGNVIFTENTEDLTEKSDLSQSAEISANDQTEHMYQLKISWPINMTNDTTDENTDLQNPDYAGKVDVIEITLKAVQKD